MGPFFFLVFVLTASFKLGKLSVSAVAVAAAAAAAAAAASSSASAASASAAQAPIRPQGFAVDISGSRLCSAPI